MRVAAIDCGTNTLLLLVADVDEKGVRAVEDQADIVRLGEGLDRTGLLKPEAMARARDTLERYTRRIAELGCDCTIAVGTEALRRASNRHLFINAATSLLGTVGATLQVIDGVREARLSWRAVAVSFPELRGRRTVVDIGGGSTEILVGETSVERAVSLPIGSVRLTERLLAHDPPTGEERRALACAIDEALAAAFPPGEPERIGGAVVGIAGTVTTLAAMAQRLTTYDGDRVHGSRFTLPSLRETVRALGETPLADRRRTPGLDPKRADVIYAGAVILEQVLTRVGASECVVSDRGIRWGLVYEAAGLG